MILPKYILNKIDYYKYEFRTSPFNRPTDIIIVYSKTFYWGKKTFKFKRICTYIPETVMMNMENSQN
jgi:hypothetical protein